MRKSEEKLPSADGRTQLVLTLWEVEREPRAVIQLTHGMAEFIGRYDELAKYLCNAGFHVVGYDLLAHGASVNDESEWGDYEVGAGAEHLIADTDAVRRFAVERYGGDVPYFLLGHSMGSFIVRCYIARFGAGLSGAIICGTGAQPASKSSMGHAIARTIGFFRGSHYRSNFVNNLGIGAYNKRFEPARTPVDWLSKNTESVDAYMKDPRDQFIFTVGGYAELTHLTKVCEAPATFASTPRDLPLLIISGADDPVGEFGVGPTKVYGSYIDSGHDDVLLKLYEGDRHELFQELDRRDVFGDVIAWIEKHLPGKGEV